MTLDSNFESRKIGIFRDYFKECQTAHDDPTRFPLQEPYKESTFDDEYQKNKGNGYG
jgi:hypothetical protein